MSQIHLITVGFDIVCHMINRRRKKDGKNEIIFFR